MKYTRAEYSKSPSQKFDIIEISKEEHIADCLIELIDQGISEDRHLFGSDWRNLDVKDLKSLLEDDMAFEKMLQFAKEGIKEQLKEVLEDLEE